MKGKDDTTIGKGKLGHSEAPMAQEQDTHPEDDKSPWDMRRLKGLLFIVKILNLLEEFMNNMNKIKNHKTTYKQKKLEF